MTCSPVAERWFDRIWLLAFFAISATYCLSTSAKIGATFDEPLYVRAGLHFWHTGSLGPFMNMGTMPLPSVVGMFPVYLIEEIRGTPFNTWDDFHEFLPFARATTLIFWAILLVMVGRIAGSLGGPWAARLAIAFVACEPNLLAHASLVTTDIALSAMLLLFAYTFREGRGRTWRWRIAIPTLTYALAMLAKASTLAFAPLCMIVIEWEYFRRCQREGNGQEPFSTFLRRFVMDCLQIGSLGLIVVFLVCGSDWETQPSFVQWSQQLPPGGQRDWMIWLAEQLRIFPNAGNALAFQIKHNMKGHSVFLLGADYPRAVWYYFPVVLAIKLTLPLLVGITTVLVLRPRLFANWVGYATLLLFLFSLNCRVQIGIRLIFPCVIFAIIALAVALSRWSMNLTSQRARRGFQFVSVLGVMLTAIASLTIWPNSLTFINQAWGGPRDGYHLVSDSNYDWAQGLPELEEWKRNQDITDLPTWYFGTDPAIFRIAGGSLPIHEWKLQSINEFEERIQGKYLAVCLTNLYGSYTSRPDLRLVVEYLRKCTPIARTTTFMIYDFRELSAKSLSIPETATDQ